MRKITHIVIHHSASPRDSTTVEDIERWHKERGFRTVGYHRVIEADGSVRVGRDDAEVGAHVKGKNSHTLGVCLTGNFMEEEPTESQLESLDEVVGDWRRKHPAAKVVGHRDLASTACPGDNLYKLINIGVVPG